MTLETPTNTLYKFMLWLNKRAKKILSETEDRFNFDLTKHKEKNENTCYFFGSFDPKPKRPELNEKWKDFEKETVEKSNKRDSLIKRLLVVTFFSLPGIVAGVHTLPVTQNVKVLLAVLLSVLGIIFTKAIKSQVLSKRGSGYKYHLYKIYLEERYPKDIVPLTIRNRNQRGDQNTPKKERGSSLNKHSFTDNELLIVFIVQILYLGAIIISTLIAYGALK